MVRLNFLSSLFLPGPGKKSLFRKLMDRLPWRQRYAILAVWNVVLVSTAALMLAMVYFTLHLPHPMSAAAAAGTPVIRIIDKYGSVLSERGRRHPYMPIKLIPKHVIDAIVATEDRRFHDHWGIDPVGLARAMLSNIRTGAYLQGGSTLTQQLAKNLYLTSERTISRKAEEILLAFWLEFRLSKTEILELYLNRVYFGAGAYGIESAAQKYFSKSARELSLPEAALLAGLPKAPSVYAPISNPGMARTRARSVLAKMRDAGVIDAKTAAVAIAQSVRFADFRPHREPTGNEYALDYIYEHMPQLSGLEQSEIIVETTLDASLQKAAQRLIEERLSTNSNDARSIQGAAVVLDPDGGIIAMIGGRSYELSQFNRATQAMRQPGSAFKPIVYLAALEAGLSPTSEVDDAPITIGAWRPRNNDDRYLGRITLSTALARSSNTAAARVFQHVGPQRVHETARRLGIKSRLHGDATLALGTAEIPLLEMVGAYVHLANGGSRIRPHIIRQVRTVSGRIVYARRAPRHGTAVAEQYVSAMNDMLREVVISGTGRRSAIPGHQSAGKTGTTQGARDAWFIGYTAHLTGGIWIGTDGAEVMQGLTGGTLPAEIWRDVMQIAHKRLPPRPLPFVGSPNRSQPVPDRSQQEFHLLAKVEPSAPSPPLPARRPATSEHLEQEKVHRGHLDSSGMMSLGLGRSN